MVLGPTPERVDTSQQVILEALGQVVLRVVRALRAVRVRHRFLALIIFQVAPPGMAAQAGAVGPAGMAGMVAITEQRQGSTHHIRAVHDPGLGGVEGAAFIPVVLEKPQSHTRTALGATQAETRL